jgi:hypothetical protein
MKQPLEKPRAEGRTERQPVGLGRRLQHDRVGDTEHQKRKCHEKPRDRSGGGDVEQRLPRWNRTADADDGAERPDQHRGPRNEKRKGGRYAVVAAREVMPHFVGTEDQEEQGGVGDAARQPGEADEGAPRRVEVERSLPDPAPRHRRREERGDEESPVEPKPGGSPARIDRRRRGGGEVVHDAPRKKSTKRRRSIATGNESLASAPADSDCTLGWTPGAKQAWRRQRNAV